MSLSKLRPELIELLPDKGISEMNEFQSRILTGVRSGKHLLVEGPIGSGRTTAAFLSVLQKVDQPGEGSPRAIVVCSTDEAAKELYKRFEEVSRALDLTIDLANEKGNMLQQRNDIFDGTEIIVGTPKRIYDLYIQNGFNVSQMKLFILDDAVDLFRKGHKMQLSRLSDSMPKCQHVLFSHSFAERRIEDYLEEYLPVHELIEAE
jgi:superfamily II DNA/RNA helicase